MSTAAPVPAIGRALGEAVLVAPADPRGPALTDFVTRVRAAARVGDVIVDERACAGWSAGQRLVLERLRGAVARRGRRWVTT